MTGSTPPPAPQRIDPELLEPAMAELYQGVREALAALPAEFEFDNPVSGIDATDLHALNTLMATGIEGQVVEVLNALRTVWDRNRRWSDYYFVRSAQSFPDVRLGRRTNAGFEPVLGIELKGWFLLSKEGVPSLRYSVAADACAPQDLICVVPWYLSNAVSGKPQVAPPWVEQARYAAEWRDYWWKHLRKTSDSPEDRELKVPADAKPYPSKADQVSVVPVKDGGMNFGRLPRYKPLMDAFIEDVLEHPILGIPAGHWMEFLKLHSDNADPEQVVHQLAKKFGTSNSELSEESEKLHGVLRTLTQDFDFQ